MPAFRTLSPGNTGGPQELHPPRQRSNSLSRSRSDFVFQNGANQQAHPNALTVLILLLGVVVASGASLGADEVRPDLLVVEKGSHSVGFYTWEGQHVKSVPVGELPHEAVLSTDGRLAYITDNGSMRFRDPAVGGTTVSIIDVEAMAPAGKIELGSWRRPHGLSLDPETGLLAVGTENPDRLLIVDPRRRTLVSDHAVAGRVPHMVLLGAGAQVAYVAHAMSGTIEILDLRTNASRLIPVGEQPQAMALSPDGRELYVACTPHIAVVDVVTAQVVGQMLPGGNRLALTGDGSLLVYSSARNGIGFADPVSRTVQTHLDLPHKLYSLTLSRDESLAFASAEERDTVYVVSVGSRSILRQFSTPAGSRPDVVLDVGSYPRPKISRLPLRHLDAFPADFPRFRRRVVEDNFPRAYQVTTADLDGDGRQDIVALATDPSRLQWYRGPDWERRDFGVPIDRPIDLAAADIDRDGHIDIAVAGGFYLREPGRDGFIAWLRNPGHASGPWSRHEIDRVPAPHRLRFADVDGDGKSELASLPIVSASARPPRFRGFVELKLYSVSAHPTTEPWPARVLAADLDLAHGLTTADMNADGRDDLMTADGGGLRVFQLESASGDTPAGRSLARGTGADRPKHGVSEIAYGGGPHPFIATIEPWHGENVMIYRQATPSGERWNGSLLDDSFNDGHALLAADLDADGEPEVVAGHRGLPYGLFIYRRVQDGGWERMTLDGGGMSAAGLHAADLNGDGRLDLVAAGTHTHNIVWYENLP